MKQRGTKNLTYTQRLILEQCLKAKLHKKVIAAKLGVCLATVYNEMKRGEYKERYKVYDFLGDYVYKEHVAYSPNLSQDNYKLNMSSKGRPIKLGKDYAFVNYVEQRIREGLSPCAVLGEIKRKNLFNTNISKTTLYRYIERGFFYNVTLKDLPLPKRKKHKRKTVAKRPPKGTSIEKRPTIIAERKEFGHWEMDCVIGKSAETLLTMVERTTRKIIIFKMPNHKAQSVVRCLNVLERRYGGLFRKVFKSITVDNGVEFSDVASLERSIYKGKRTDFYYCHPYCSCERGTNERLNREVRRKLPKGMSFGNVTKADVQFVEDWVNAYPRGIFNYATSQELFEQQLAQL